MQLDRGRRRPSAHLHAQKMNVYALYPSRRFVDAKVRTWVEMLRAQVPGMIARDVEMLNAIGREPQAA
ncbi:hypothetical protein BFF94_006570 [Burkholderia catarinensis]|nr:hypothetical protein BFF94_006570 [Burkholderia catarinensis]